MANGRNDPCRCGSGKKFKRCCGRSFVDSTSTRPPHSPAIADLARQALASLKNGQLVQAKKACLNILQIQPGNAEAFHLLGIIAAQLRSYDEAIENFRRAIVLEPRQPAFHYNLAKALKETNDFPSAIAGYRKALSLDPEFLDAALNLGNVLKEAGRLDEAAACFKAALAKSPGDGEMHYNLGNVHVAQGRLEDAATCFRAALACKPGFAEAITNLGNVLKEQGRLQDAVDCYREAMGLAPAYLAAQHNLLYTLNFDYLETPEEVFAEHRRFGLRLASKIASGPVAAASPRASRVRLGYVSADFRTHSCAYFLEPLLGAHDATRFEVFCYSDVKHPDTTTARLKKLAGHWRDVSRLNDDALSEVIRQDNLDILVDLAGHTEHNRLPVFAGRAAPIQVAWLGYPNTTGLATVDYRLTDSRADPEGETDFLYTERLLRLPVSFLCYQPPPGSPPVVSPPCEKNGYVTFGCFNNASKVTPSVMSVWSELLTAVSDSKLLLKSRQFKDQATRERYLDLFESFGVDRDRVELIGQLPNRHDHLAAYGKVDIALDPFPYNGTTTTCEALWMGVPVISLAGEMHAGRVGVSLLHSIGLEALIARTPAEYVSKGAKLASDCASRAKARKTLRDSFLNSPLCDGKRFARDVESALLGLM